MSCFETRIVQLLSMQTIMEARASIEQLLREKRQASSSSSTSREQERLENLCLEEAEADCPFGCVEGFDLTSLIFHINDEHPLQQRAVNCPYCNHRSRDLLQHLLKHAEVFQDCSCISSGAQTPAPNEASTPKEWEHISEGLLGLGLASYSYSDTAQEEVEAANLAFALEDTGKDAKASGSSQIPAAVEAPSIPQIPLPQYTTSEMRAKYMRSLVLSAFNMDRR